MLAELMLTDLKPSPQGEGWFYATEIFQGQCSSAQLA